jgi:hypothetical protein
MRGRITHVGAESGHRRSAGQGHRDDNSDVANLDVLDAVGCLQ